MTSKPIHAKLHILIWKIVSSEILSLNTSQNITKPIVRDDKLLILFDQIVKKDVATFEAHEKLLKSQKPKKKTNQNSFSQ